MTEAATERRNADVNIPSRLTDEEFAAFQRLTNEATGIQIGENKRSMIYSRFARRLRIKGMNNFSDYISLLASKNSEEHRFFINTVTTNLTFFFRESHHFDYLANETLPDIAKNKRGRKLKVWSSASSSGQEPYSLAMVLAESQHLAGWTSKILATDIDTDMVQRTKEGIYDEEQMRGLDAPRRQRWVDSVQGGKFQVKRELRDMLICKPLNLFNKWPIKAPVDVIFCRNVLIYFDKTDQFKIVKEFAKMQAPGDYLFLGHSESFREIVSVYKPVSNTVYRRI
ncbi:MAG: CheR family methyltransferase [Burkholderiaceae bacterium]